MQRLERDAAYWLALDDLIILLYYRNQNHQPWDGTTIAWALPHQSLIKKMSSLQLDLIEVFSQLSFPPFR